jgi:hypothetical protein
MLPHVALVGGAACAPPTPPAYCSGFDDETNLIIKALRVIGGVIGGW